MNKARIVISGLSGGSGKTIASLGIVRRLVQLGRVVQPCKKGPDYIDYAWLGLAAGRPCASLDPFFLSDGMLAERFAEAVQAPVPADIAVIEGNRGLFDGRDLEGSCSTAHVARVLSAPVLLVMNCAKMTRTAAAIVSGMEHFDPQVRIAGVLLNNTAGPRHAALLRSAVEHYTDVPVLGVLPRLHENPIPERHLGLSLRRADPACAAVPDRLAQLAADCIDMDAVQAAADAAPPIPAAIPGSSPSGEQALPRQDTISTTAPARHDGCSSIREPQPPAASAIMPSTGPGLASAPEEASKNTAPISRTPRIGYVRDDALWFYYEENLDALHKSGAELVELGIIDPSAWPADLDGLYLGGGYPELFAARLETSPHLGDIRRLSEHNRPVYAECGGFMILCRSLVLRDGRHGMAGLFDVETHFSKKPQALGYVSARAVRANPFHPAGVPWTGHEFHYSRCEWVDGQRPECCLELKSGKGLLESKGVHMDGLLVRSTFACWTHLFAPAVPHWAHNFVAAARNSRD